MVRHAHLQNLKQGEMSFESGMQPYLNKANLISRSAESLR